MLKLVKKVTKRMGVKTTDLNPYAEMGEIVTEMEQYALA